MSSINKAIIIGNLGQDPDSRITQGGTSVCNLSVGTSEKYKDSNGEYQENTEWHRVVCWGNLADICAKYLSKGSKVYIEGSLQTRKWEDKQGNDRYTTEIKAYKMLMLDSKNPQKSDNNNQPQETGNLTVNFDEDSLPF